MSKKKSKSRSSRVVAVSDRAWQLLKDHRRRYGVMSSSLVSTLILEYFRDNYPQEEKEAQS